VAEIDIPEKAEDCPKRRAAGAFTVENLVVGRELIPQMPSKLSPITTPALPAGSQLTPLPGEAGGDVFEGLRAAASRKRTRRCIAGKSRSTTFADAMKIKV